MLLSQGKVRDIYEADDGRLLIVTSDRISTYDVVHPTPIPDKGRVLTGLSVFWFDRMEAVCPNHLVSYTDVPDDARGRGMLVERLEMFPVECVVRGYITGSGWKDYQATGAVCGIELPAGLQESEQLPEPIFTPATKAAVGDHDENVDIERAADLVGGADVAEELRSLSIELYTLAAEHARERGIILADTKFEFGRDSEGRIVVGDEVCTPDSSRFWPADTYQPGRSQPSFDKQFVRDWAAGSGWDKTPPAPELPDEVVQGTRARYVEAYERIAGEPFDAWLERSGASGVKARVLIRPKEGILDPQGQAVERALAALGFDGVGQVHVGRLVELEVEDHTRVAEMCDRLLTNPLIEDYEIQVVQGAEA